MAYRKPKIIHLFPRQSTIRDTLTDQLNGILELLIGGGAGGSKTFTGCLWLATLCANNPGIRCAIGRSKLKTLRTTTLRTLTSKILKPFFGYVEGHDYIVTGSNDIQSPNTVKFRNGSEILLVDLKYYPSLDPEFDDLGSLELTCGFIDEVAQVSQKAYQVFSSRIGRWKNKELNLKAMLLMSCNPAKNRVYTDFYKPMKAGTIDQHKRFIQVLAKDNPNIETAYIEKLELMPEGPMKQRLFYGNREYDDDTFKIYKYPDLVSLFTNKGKTTGEKYIICDVAGAGKDKAIVGVFDGRKLIDYKIELVSTPESIKNIMQAFANMYIVKRQNRLYDGSGLGRGLTGLECPIFQGGGSSVEVGTGDLEQEASKRAYKNLRSQCFFLLSQYIADGSLGLECIDAQEKETILEELDTIQYWNVEKDGPLQIIPKDEIKKLIGRSPDRADLLSMRVRFELNKSNEPNFY